jgi:5'-nucleotidase
MVSFKKVHDSAVSQGAVDERHDKHFEKPQKETSMPYPIDQKLVVAVSSTALFDLSKEHELYLKTNADEFRKYQKENRRVTPEPGPAFPFIQRLLNLNTIYSDEKPIEVVILSRNHADAGLRVMDAISEYGLDISRSFFLAGTLPYPYMRTANACLYLSTNKEEVKTAVAQGYPAGHVLPCITNQNDPDKQLRIAFDFDGVIASDESEIIYDESKDLDIFYEHEKSKREQPLKSGPLMPLLQRLSKFQKLERHKAQEDKSYKQMLRIAVVTARNAPAHERLINTLASLEIDTDELFLLGGIEKKLVLDVLKPQIFFDDQIGHLEPASETTPSVHIPFGVKN